MSEAESRWRLYLDDQTRAGSESAKRNISGVEQATRQLNDRFGLGLPLWAGTAAAAAGLGVALSKTVGFMKSAVAAAAEEEAVLRRLSTAVTLAGHDYGALEGSLKVYFDQLQATTQFADEQAASALVTLTTVIGDFDRSLQVLPLALDMASTGLFDVDSASRALGQVMEGQTGRLTRMVPALKEMKAELGDNASKAERTAWMLDILNDRFGGAAQRNVESYTGKLAQLKNATQDIKENLGDIAIPQLTVTVEVLRIIAGSGVVEGLLGGLMMGGSLVPGPGAARKRTTADAPLYKDTNATWEAINRILGPFASRGYKEYWAQRAAAANEPGFIGPMRPAMGLPTGQGMTFDDYLERERIKRLNAVYGLAVERQTPAWAAPTVAAFGAAGREAAKGMGGSAMGDMAKIPEVPFGEDTAEKIWDLLDPLTKLHAELEATGLAWRDWGGAVDEVVAGTAASLGHLGTAYMQLFEGQKKAFPAAMQMIAQEMAARIKAIGAQAAIKALESSAWAFYYMAQGNMPAAGFMLKSAAGFALTATAAGAAAGAIYHNAGGASWSGAESSSSSEGTAGRSAVVSGRYGGSSTTTAAALAPTTINVTHIITNAYYGSETEASVASIQEAIDTGKLYTEREVQ